MPNSKLEEGLRVLFEKGLYEKIFDQRERIEAEGTTKSNYYLATSLLILKKYRYSETLLKALLATDETNGAILNNLSAALIFQDKLDEALIYLQLSQKYGVISKDINANYARVLVKKKLSRDAINLFTQLPLQKDFDSSTFFYLLDFLSGFLPLRQYLQPIILMEKNHSLNQNDRLRLIKFYFHKALYLRAFPHLKKLKSTGDCDSIVYNFVGVILEKRFKLRWAEGFLTAAINTTPSSNSALLNLISLKKKAGELQEALSLSTAGSAQDPLNITLLNQIGIINFLLGKTVAAIQSFETAITLDNDNGDIWFNLAEIQDYKFTKMQLETILKIVNNDSLSPGNRSHACFAISRHYEKINKYKQSSIYLKQANSFKSEASPYVPDDDKKVFKACKKKFLSKSCLKIEDIQLTNSSTIPVFVVGMPRSGTTLVQQVLTSHTKIDSAGEVDFVRAFGLNLILKDGDFQHADLKKFRVRYQSCIKKLNLNGKFIIDKMPQNFLFLPLILSAFPEAKIIFMSRNQNAVRWSNLRQNYHGTGLGFTNDLESLDSYLAEFNALRRLLAQKKMANVRILKYSSLINDAKKNVEALCEFLGVPFEEAMLAHEKNKTVSLTASSQQVKRKIYKGADKKWIKFIKYY